MTDEELKALVASLAVRQEETARQMAQTDRRLEEIGDFIRQLAAESREADARLEEKLNRMAAEFYEADAKLEEKLNRMVAEFHAADEKLQQKLDQLAEELRSADAKQRQKIDRLGEMVGGISNNNGYFAEELFIASLEKNPRIGPVNFDSVHSHYKGASRKGFEYEYDAFLQNGSHVGLVEIKYRLHPDAVRSFATEAVPRFREIFPQFADKKIVAAVAGASIPDEALKTAEEHGLAVLAQEGNSLRVLSDKIREF